MKNSELKFFVNEQKHLKVCVGSISHYMQSYRFGISVDARLFHDGEEFGFIYFSISILVELIDHGLKLVVTQVLLHFSGYSS